ncbi:MAG: DUF3817 domain-containing protein [Bacteroidetes bacterium]|nr:MAG: DUF3817 domain-containing protein [Bacteroidota bacterium]TAG87158.1 MAG: DUF3817 domain-containing protein [Bacteroidota bacterium]
MEQNIFSSLSILKIVAKMEGWSYLLLLGLAMPLKYFANLPQFVQVIGMIHGLLFVSYLMLVVNAHVLYDWQWKKTFWVAIASLFPFAPFYVDKKMLVTEKNT